MLDSLLYVNLLLVAAGLVLEFLALRKREIRFVRVVGALGFGMLVFAYMAAIFNPSAGMLTSVVRPGLMLIFASIVARNIHEHYAR